MTEYINKDFYKQIPANERHFIKLSQEAAYAAVKELKAANIPHSATISEYRSVVTVNRVDSVNAERIAEKAAKEFPNVKKVFGNTEYKAIRDRKYIDTDADTARKIAALLSGNTNNRFSGIIRGEKATITVSGEKNAAAVRAMVENLKNMDLLEALRERGYERTADTNGFVNIRNMQTGEVCGFNGMAAVRDMFDNPENEFFYPLSHRIAYREHPTNGDYYYYIQKYNSADKSSAKVYRDENNKPALFKSVDEVLSYTAANGIEITNIDEEIANWREVDREREDNSIIEENRKLIENFPISGGDYIDLISYDPNNDTFSWVYFNPDGDDGNGEFIDKTITKEDIFAAYSARIAAEGEQQGRSDFIAYLNENCKEDVIEIHSGYFAEYADDYINYASRNFSYYFGISENSTATMSVDNFISSLETNCDEVKKDKQKREQPQEITASSFRVELDGYSGAWNVIENAEIDGRELFMLENDYYGDSVAYIVADKDGNIVDNNVWGDFEEYENTLVKRRLIEAAENSKNGTTMPVLKEFAEDMKKYGFETYEADGIFTANREDVAGFIRMDTIGEILYDISEKYRFEPNEVGNNHLLDLNRFYDSYEWNNFSNLKNVIDNTVIALRSGNYDPFDNYIEQVKLVCENSEEDMLYEKAKIKEVEEHLAKVKAVFGERNKSVLETEEKFPNGELSDEDKTAEIPQESNIHFGYFGNGVLCYDTSRLDKEIDDYLSVAHISNEGNIRYYVDDLTESDKQHIENHAKGVKDRFTVYWNGLSLQTRYGMLYDRLLETGTSEQIKTFNADKGSMGKTSDERMAAYIKKYEHSLIFKDEEFPFENAPAVDFQTEINNLVLEKNREAVEMIEVGSEISLNYISYVIKSIDGDHMMSMGKIGDDNDTKQYVGNWKEQLLSEAGNNPLFVYSPKLAKELDFIDSVGAVTENINAPADNGEIISDDTDRTDNNVNFLTDNIPDLDNETAEKLVNAFAASTLSGWDKGDNQAKINRIKKSLYDILSDEDKTEKAYALISKNVYNHNSDTLDFHFGGNDGSEWFTESELLHNFVKSNRNISFSLANALIGYLDEKQHAEREVDELKAGWYDKTDYKIKANIDGEIFDYKGRFDIGDGKGTGGGTLVDHIRQRNEYIIKLESYPYNTKEAKDNARFILDVFVPFLEKYSAMTPEEEKILEEFKENNPIKTSAHKDELSNDDFEIFQVKSGDEYLYKRFMDLSALGHSPSMSDYDRVYKGTLSEIDVNAENKDDILNNIYTKFNVNHPEDFKGHSLSVSDIVVLHKDGAATAHYVDDVGFKDVPEFLQEKAMEQPHTLSVGDIVTFADRPNVWRVSAINDTQIDFENTDQNSMDKMFSHIDFGQHRDNLREKLKYSVVSQDISVREINIEDKTANSPMGNDLNKPLDNTEKSVLSNEKAYVYSEIKFETGEVYLVPGKINDDNIFETEAYKEILEPYADKDKIDELIDIILVNIRHLSYGSGKESIPNDTEMEFICENSTDIINKSEEIGNIEFFVHFWINIDEIIDDINYKAAEQHKISPHLGDAYKEQTYIFSSEYFFDDPYYNEAVTEIKIGGKWIEAEEAVHEMNVLGNATTSQIEALRVRTVSFDGIERSEVLSPEAFHIILDRTMKNKDKMKEAAELYEKNDGNIMPVYTKTPAEATEAGEREKYFADKRENERCAASIRYSIGCNNDGMHFNSDKAISELLGTYSIDRIALIIAAKVSNSGEWDKRFSRENVEWAKNLLKAYPVEKVVTTSHLGLNSHSVLINSAADELRSNFEMFRSMQNEKETKVTADVHEQRNFNENIKNLSQLKRTLTVGTEFFITDHVRSECVGERRRVTEANTACFYSQKINSDGTAEGKPLYMEWGKAANWNFENGVCTSSLDNKEKVMSFKVFEEDMLNVENAARSDIDVTDDNNSPMGNYAPQINDVIENDDGVYKVANISENYVTLLETDTLLPEEKTISMTDFYKSEFSLLERDETISAAIDTEKPVEKVESLANKAENYAITDENSGDMGGAKSRYAANIKAIKVLKSIEADNRTATPAEQDILAKYTGWGAISQAFDGTNTKWSNEYAELKKLLTPEEYEAARHSTMNAHYTSPTVISAMYDVLNNLGFEKGNILEPAMGTGNFFGMLPDLYKDSKLYGVELDSITGRIAQQLYPNADIQVMGYEKTSFPDNSFDVAIGNVPFGDYKISDKRYNDSNFNIHDYFFAKTLDKVHAGGIIAFVTSKGTMDKENDEIRRYIAQRAELLGAIRLPNNAFKATAGTEVTSDILILQKRERPIEINPDSIEWLKKTETADGLSVNNYFVQHPEMVLGKITEGNKLYGNSTKDTSCTPIEGADLKQQLAEAIKNIKGTYRAADIEIEPKNDDIISAPANSRKFSFYEQDGNIYYREADETMKKVNVSKDLFNRAIGMIELRDSVHELLNLQIMNNQGYLDNEVADSRKKLNTLYDNFVKKYGNISTPKNAKAFKGDNGYFVLSALETKDENGKVIGKADIFTKNTVKPKIIAAHVETAQEALILSVSEKGKVDFDFMTELCGMDKDRLISELDGQIYKLPQETEKYVTADEYLSGNIRKKMLDIANSGNPNEYEKNYAALQAAMPPMVEAKDISVKLGSHWVDPKYIRQFIIEKLNPDARTENELNVSYSKVAGTWKVEGQTATAKTNHTAINTYGTRRKNAYEIIEGILNNSDLLVKDRKKDEYGVEVRDKNGNYVLITNEEETKAVRHCANIIKSEFVDWIFKDPDRRETLVNKYNEIFNSFRYREYDGSHLKFVGMNTDITLKEHQRNAIARGLYGGNTLLAHAVGAGKTYEMIAIAMEGKRLGLHNKSLFAVPNSLTEQIGNDFRKLYPNANILVATKKDFEKDNRATLLAKMATNDWDAVIVGHSQFDRMGLSPQRESEYLYEEIEKLRSELEKINAENPTKKKSFTVKNIEKSITSYTKRLNDLTEKQVKDDFIDFEQLGFDKIFVDECHMYKNLATATKMRNVAGLGSRGSARAFNLLMKAKYLDILTDGKGTVFASGTPVITGYQRSEMPILRCLSRTTSQNYVMLFCFLVSGKKTQGFMMLYNKT